MNQNQDDASSMGKSSNSISPFKEASQK